MYNAYHAKELRVKRARELTRLHFEPGNQKRCLRSVWRRFVEPEMGVCYRTYLRWLK